jgi:hypothetical protein
MVRACPCHACAFFSSRQEENAVLLPFMAEGIAAGDTCVNILDPGAREERLRSLAGYGIDVAAAERSGRLELRPWEQAQAAGGRFDQHAMLAGLQAAAESGVRERRTTRLWSNQEWALAGLPGSENLVEYESRFNEIWPGSNDVVVCVYDTTKFRADVLFDVLRAHPLAIVGGKLRENPFYVPPAELLQQLRDGHSSSGHDLCGPAHGTGAPGLSAGEADGIAALGICESLLIALTERGILSDEDVRGLLSDVAAAHIEAAGTAPDPGRHHAVARIVERLFVAKNGVRH